MAKHPHICGYTRLGVSQGDGSYNAGYSLYSAAWPLLKEYPGHEFQSGLFGTWMFADSEKPDMKEDVWFYSDIEGGLGWWRDTEYPTETPKFIMGAVALGFSEWANGPGAGKGRDWSDPKGKYGVAQLSPNLLWPPDGVNLKQGTCGELLGYGYLALPLADAKATTAGSPIPTGEQCWTLFMNAANFKGPATFVLPYFFSKPCVKHPATAGLFLDSRPARQNRTHSMETQYIPWAQAVTKDGQVFARMAPTYLPSGTEGSAVLHQVMAYNQGAMWDRMKAWFEGGKPVDTEINPAHAFAHAFDETRGVEWAVWEPDIKREERVPLAAHDFVRPSLADPYSLAYAPHGDLVKRVDVGGRSMMILPEYYRFVEDGDRGKWIAVPPEDVPPELELDQADFSRPEEPPPSVYVTPDDPASCWKKPGPVAGPFQAFPGDGSKVTYYWYRFADQPALLNADMTDTEREEMQARVERIHHHWTRHREYMAPPKRGKLAEIDPALIVTPPDGLEVGYVPIVTEQGPAT